MHSASGEERALFIGTILAFAMMTDTHTEYELQKTEPLLSLVKSDRAEISSESCPSESLEV